MQTLANPGQPCQAAAALVWLLPTRRQQLTSWLKQKEGHDTGALGIDLLETANLTALANDTGPRPGPSGCSAVQPGSVAAGGAGTAAVFESLDELYERLDETPLA